MKTKILDGRAAAEKIYRQLRPKIRAWRPKPTLAAIVIGRRPDSLLYVRMKQRAAARVGMQSVLVQLPTSISQASLIQKIQQLNTDDRVTGILLQFPLPSHLEPGRVIKHIARQKDVDGLRADSSFASAFLQSLLHLAHLGRPDHGSAVILAQPSPLRTQLVKRLRKNYRPVHVATGLSRLPLVTKKAALIFSFRGRGPKLAAHHISQPVIIDGGIRQLDGQLVGDTDRSVIGLAKAVSPVPGGVGPLTVAFLIRNTFFAAKKRRRRP